MNYNNAPIIGTQVEGEEIIEEVNYYYKDDDSELYRFPEEPLDISERQIIPISREEYRSLLQAKINKQ